MPEEKKPYKGADDFMSRMVADVKAETPVEETPQEVVEETPEEIVETPEEVVETPTEEVEKPSEKETPEGNTETPPEEETPSTEDSEEEIETDEDGNILDWDAEETPSEEKTEISQVNYQDMATHFEIESEKPITNLDEFRAALEAKIKAKEDAARSESQNILEGVPQDLVEAIEIAKQGGDYKALVTEKEVDYNEFGQEDFLFLGFKQYFQTPDGNLNEEGLQEYIDGMKDVDKKIAADQIKSTLESKQQARLASITQAATAKKAQELERAQTALSKIDNISNLKLADKHKEQILNVITSGKLQSLIFGMNEKGELDYNQVAEVVFNKLYGDKISKVNSQRVRNSVKREMLDKMANKTTPQGSSGSSLPNPATVDNDPMDGWLKQLGAK